MDRRRFVAGVGGALPWVAGCTASRSESGPRPQSGTVESGRRYALEAHPIGADGIRVAFATQAGELPDGALDLFLATLDGSDDPRTYGHREFEYAGFVEYGGRFYRVTVDETGQKTRERPVLLAEPVESEAARQKAVHWSTYSGDDDAALRRAASQADSEDGNANGNGSECDCYVLRHRDPDESDLLPQPKHEYVRYDGSVLRLSVERRELTETEYTYETTRVADSTTAFREFVREEVVDVWLDDSNLSERQRTVFEAARAGEYAESGDLSAAYRGLLERIFGDLPADTTGERVGYDGRTHEVHVHVGES
ncbi:hypothetical protein M0R88_05660 [Halorussus gelatinilyticus]|uniref:Uncharacterized protein n=1 Tax=Halorussus gelatinilyticus TaxID=2937524 RepID=A0A8U0INJ7_9EURY|nr:hypothetical protein [Halorussus gelatinilyticus]UPW01589.1 hypothetical protein M0R88_05660 [Halorussus gelatinilyticus]